MRKPLTLFFVVFLLLTGPCKTEGKEQPSFTNNLGMEFVLIPQGSFLMGCDAKHEDCYGTEEPRHRVNLTQAFYLGKFEVTQKQWTSVMGDNPSAVKNSTNPVENVSWNDAQEFISRLNQKEEKGHYRLPTEAEWEYAARAGSTSPYFFGNNEDGLEDYAWFGEYREDGQGGQGQAHPVGQKKPNAWGLYDIYGNVFEWVMDGHNPSINYYAESPQNDPKGPKTSAFRVTRGGSWASMAQNCRSAFRVANKPDRQRNDLGFRLVFIPNN